MFQPTLQGTTYQFAVVGGCLAGSRILMNIRLEGARMLKGPEDETDAIGPSRISEGTLLFHHTVVTTVEVHTVTE